MREIRHIVEAAAFLFFLFLFRVMPLDMASGIGGWLGRTIGPRLGVTRTARRNLMRALPERAAEHEQIIRGMWDNLGRTFIEYAHVFPVFGRDAIAKRIRMVGVEHMEKLNADGKAILFISGHFGNWELMPKSAAILGRPMLLVYRESNNPYIDRILHRLRASYYTDMVPKSTAGARTIVKALAKKQPVAMLVDQKMNNGVESVFFGHPAMTAPTPAQLGVKGISLLPAHLRRFDGAHFELHIFPPMDFASTGNAEVDTQAGMRQINGWLEDCIRAYPDQWFWVHNRWPKESD